MDPFIYLWVRCLVNCSRHHQLYISPLFSFDKLAFRTWWTAVQQGSPTWHRCVYNEDSAMPTMLYPFTVCQKTTDLKAWSSSQHERGKPVMETHSKSDNIHKIDTAGSPSWTCRYLRCLKTASATALYHQSLQISFSLLMCPPSCSLQKAWERSRVAHYAIDRLQNSTSECCPGSFGK